MDIYVHRTCPESSLYSCHVPCSISGYFLISLRSMFVPCFFPACSCQSISVSQRGKSMLRLHVGKTGGKYEELLEIRWTDTMHWTPLICPWPTYIQHRSPHQTPLTFTNIHHHHNHHRGGGFGGSVVVVGGNEWWWWWWWW